MATGSARRVVTGAGMTMSDAVFATVATMILLLVVFILAALFVALFPYSMIVTGVVAATFTFWYWWYNVHD
jgi:hypothetical protein